MRAAGLRLHEQHEARGAVFRVEAGRSVPGSYGSEPSEVAAVREGAGAIDLSDRGKVEVRGPDRVAFLDGLVTADVKVLEPGALAYALALTDKSRVVGDVRIVALEDRFLLDLEGAQKEVFLDHIRRHLVSDDVDLLDLGPIDHLEVHGPRAVGIASTAIGMDLRAIAPDRAERFPIGKRGTGRVVRTRTLEEPAVALWAAEGSLGPAWDRLLRLGAAPVGRDAFETLRIEAGVPRVGADMGEFTLALEVAPQGTISFTKGCYVGQEVVARGTYRGHMNRKLFGLRIDGDVPPARGDRVVVAGDEVGRITSGTWSPTLGRAIALSLLRIDRVSARETLFVDRAGWDLRAALQPLPFVRGHP